MRRVLRSGSQEWLISSRIGEDADEAIDLRDRDRALRLFRRLLQDPENARTLRAALRDVASGAIAHRLQDAAVAEQLAAHAASGRIRLYDNTPAPVTFQTQSTGKSDAPAPAAAPPPPRTVSKTWVKFRVIDDTTGRPVSGVRLRIATPDGVENFYTTNPSGLIELDEIKRGACEARCDLKGATLADTLSFVALGQGSDDQSVDAASGGGGAGGGGGGGLKRIADLEAHKVRKGESIDGLAKAAGLTWQELSRFNWGTDNPNEINRHLRDVVGCTKKTKDGYNYVFDDSDDPGIILIPRKWEQTGLKTAEIHTLRVRQVAITRFRILYYEDANYLLPDADYTIFDDNGMIVASGASDARARLRLPDNYQEAWPIVLGRPRRVIGTVLTAGDRRPVASQKMTVRTMTRRVQTVTSGEDGRIAILRVPEGSLSVTWEGKEAVIFVDRDIDNALFLLDAPAGTDDPEHPDEHELLSEGHTGAVLTLDLVDPSDAPLAGAAVRVTQNGADVFTGNADGAGRIVISGHDPETPCEVHVEGHGTMALAGAHGDGHDEDGELPTYDRGETIPADGAGCGGDYTCA